MCIPMLKSNTIKIYFCLYFKTTMPQINFFESINVRFCVLSISLKIDKPLPIMAGLTKK